MYVNRAETTLLSLQHHYGIKTNKFIELKVKLNNYNQENFRLKSKNEEILEANNCRCLGVLIKGKYEE